jgi:hypothetical protein
MGLLHKGRREAVVVDGEERLIWGSAFRVPRGIRRRESLGGV